MSQNNIFENNNSEKQLRGIFSGKINLLFVEDNPQICKLMTEDFFCSPIFYKKSVYTVSAAKKAIAGPAPFHCWILDLTLERHNDGLDLLKAKHFLPCCIVASGAESMNDASLALKAGAYSVYDKKEIFMKTPIGFIDEICALSVLTFALKLKKAKNFELFHILIRGFIPTPERWSYSCCINERTFRRLCEEDSSLSPKQFLSLFHALYAIVLSDCIPESTQGYDEAREKIVRNIDFYCQCFDYVLDRMDSLFRPLYFTHNTHSPQGNL
jgi:hypothetical protein